MSHLGERVTPLVDGELPPDAAARAHAHLTDCAGCRDAVEVQRQARSALQSAPDPEIPVGLLSALREMGGPQGPLPPPRDLVPAAFRPPLVTLPERPPRRRGSSGPPRRVGRRGSRAVRRRMALAVLGSFSLASAGVLTAVVLTGVLPSGAATAPTAQLTFERRPATPWSQPAVARSSASTVSASLSSASAPSATSPPATPPPATPPPDTSPSAPSARTLSTSSASSTNPSVSGPSRTTATSSPTGRNAP